MAKTQETLTHQAALLEPEKIVPKQRLRRALTDPDVLDEFLVNPQKVAQRFDVSLTEEEITTVRTASHFLASWDFFCGEGQWLDGVRLDGRMLTGPLSVGDVVLDRIKARIAEEIIREMPRAIQRIASEIGGEVLVDSQESAEDLPEYVQPLVHTLRRLFRTLTREVTRGMSQTPIHPYAVRPMFQPAAFRPGVETGVQEPVTAHPGMTPATGTVDGITALSQTLGQYLQEVINHAATEAMEHIRPQPIRQQRRRGAPAPQGQPTDHGRV